MVDFRYHLVSLIAVFMALAVGVVLGAGPLQNSIGSALNDQVESLRVSRDEARTDADAANRRSEAYQQGIESLVPDMIDGSLEGQSVVIMTLANTSEETVERHRSNLSAAGAQVTGTVLLTENFFSSDTASYRNALAGQLGSYVDPGDSPLGTLARGLELIVATDANDSTAATLTELYQSADNALIEITDTLTGPATAILVIGPVGADIPEEPEEEYTTIRANQVELLGVLDIPLVLTAQTGDGSLLEAVRGDDRQISTVDSPRDTTSLINVPYAITQEVTGSTVTWGIGDTSDVVLGSLAPLELALEPDADEGETTQGEPTADPEAASDDIEDSSADEGS